MTDQSADSQAAVPTCSVAGRIARRRSRTSPYCEAHYCRLRRNGTIDDRPRSAGHYSSNGYRRVPARGHPTCTKGQDFTYEHRKVFYDTHGEGPFSCHVCGAEQQWQTMHVDHLNDNKLDNRVENLAPACPTCNQARGRPKAMATQRASLVKFEFGGISLTRTEWARRLGISRNSLQFRLDSGWSLDRALSEPRGPTGPRP